MESDTFEESPRGTPQGGILSPLLANIYLTSFDWSVGRMYHHPITGSQNVGSERARRKRHGVTPKYLFRYADDWVILTSTEQEAYRLLEKLKGYFRHRLKLELSEEKTVITDLRKSPVRFLGFCVKAESLRNEPGRVRERLVGKSYPDPQRVNKAIRKITDEIKLLKMHPSDAFKAIKIEEINSMIVGTAEYWSHSSCKRALNTLDRAVNAAALATFKRLYRQAYLEKQVPLSSLANRQDRHRGYSTRTFGIAVDGVIIGLTKAKITPSRWSKYPASQKMTPYTEEGRAIHLRESKRTQPLDRPPLYDSSVLEHASGLYNFEYYMNREYAYNREKGRCKVCGVPLVLGDRECHHIQPKLPLNRVNKVNNLAWLCGCCHQLVHGKKMDDIALLNAKQRAKIRKYHDALGVVC